MMETRAAMPVRVGINGFGRMGRLALRAAFDNSQIQIVHINELKGGPETAAHLLEFDSVHGRWRVPIAAEAHGLKINGDRVGYSNFDAPGDVPWDEAGVEIVLECSGKFLTPGALEPYFDARRAQSGGRRAGQAGRAQYRDGRQRPVV